MSTLPETVESEPASDTELLLPKTAVGDYVVEDLLGAGGFARVYRAHHHVLGTRVAIKVLSRALALDAEAMRRFVQEARAASRISFPGVVRVLGFGKLPDGRAFQVMELVEGPTLEEYLEQRERLPTDEALEILAAIAGALDAAHAANIVHRDLKPANVLLATVDGHLVPRLADFGIAKAIEGDENPHLTRTGTTLGTPTYMSPEQALGRPVGLASDIYSFGVVAFELLTGHVPFEGESAFATMMMHVQAPLPSPSTVAPALGVRFDAAVQAMMSKDPGGRPPTIAAAMTALRAEVQAPPATSSGKARRRLVAIAAAVAVVGAVVVAILARGDRPGRVSPAPTLLTAPAPRELSPPAATTVPTAPTDQAAPPRPSNVGDVTPPSSSTRRPTAPAKSGIRPTKSTADSYELPPGYEP